MLVLAAVLSGGCGTAMSWWWQWIDDHGLWTHFRAIATFTHGIDWAAMRRRYEPLAKEAASQLEVQRVIEMMMGELNASHLGIWDDSDESGGVRTGVLGLGLRTEKGLAGHRRSAEWLGECATNTHAFLTECAASGKMPTEYEVQQRMVVERTGRGMVLEGDPIVASGPHSANPHFAPTATDSSPIRIDQVVLLDLWGREDRPGSICADITWMAYVGKKVPEEVEDVWRAVTGARDAAVAFLKQRWESGEPVRGLEVDDAARGYLAERKLDSYFIHRLGHSIGMEVHGNGANLDHLETRDDRRLLTHTGFSIEPGVYLPGKFGVRSEIDVHLSPDGPEITTPMQESIPALLD